MARKHNAKHHRSPSRYLDRLSARGETTATVRMPFIDRRGRKHGTIESLRRGDAPTGDIDVEAVA